MRYLFAFAGLLSFAFAALVSRSLTTDIQLGIFALSLIGGFTLLGIAAIISRLDKLRSPKKAAHDPGVYQEPERYRQQPR